MLKIATKFKDTEIGTIPENWNVVGIGDTLNIIDGDRGINYPNGSDFSDNDYCLFLNAKNVSGDSFDFSNCQFISRTKDAELRKGKMQRGDFVLTTRGTVGNIAFYDKTVPFENMRINSGMVILRNDNDFDSKFLFQLLKSWITKRQISELTTGSAQPQLPIKDLKNIKLIKPTIVEQKQIAEILSSLDDKIELNRKVNENLEKLAGILFKKWFVDIGAELPKGWRMGKFSEAVENFDSKRIPLSSREREKRQGSYPYYGATSIMDYVENYIFDGTYVLLGEDGSVAKEDGKPFVQYVSGKIWVNNHAHVLQGKNGFSTEYVKVFLDQVNIMPFVTGAVQPKLNQANMNRIPMIIPDEKTLSRFNEVLSGFFGMILENESQIKNLETIRDSLLPRLMSGKIRVN